MFFGAVIIAKPLNNRPIAHLLGELCRYMNTFVQTVKKKPKCSFVKKGKPPFVKNVGQNLPVFTAERCLVQRAQKAVVARAIVQPVAVVNKSQLFFFKSSL